MANPGKAGIVKDSKGHTHYVIYQTYGTTCGPACAAMLAYYHAAFRQCKPGEEDRIKDLSGWKEGEGMGIGDLTAAIKKKLKIPCKLVRVDPKAALFSTLRAHVGPRTPAILYVGHSWQNSAHFTVCRRVDGDGTAVFLDPIYGLVEVDEKRLPLYRYNPTGKWLFDGGIIVSSLK
jgi:hypothetical protein